MRNLSAQGLLSSENWLSQDLEDSRNWRSISNLFGQKCHQLFSFVAFVVDVDVHVGQFVDSLQDFGQGKRRRRSDGVVVDESVDATCQLEA